MTDEVAVSQLLVGRRGRLAVMAWLALLGGLAESVVLVVVVQAAVALSGQRPGSFQVGFLRLEHVSVSTLLAVALVATAVRLGAGLAVSWMCARLAADVQKQLRDDIFEAFIDAPWATQARDREGGLQQVAGTEADRAANAVLTLSMGLAAACSLAMLLIAALVVNPLAAVGLVVVVGGLFVILRPLTSRGRRQAGSRSVEELGVAQAMTEMIRTAEEVRVHGVGDEQKRRLASETDRVALWTTRLHFSSLSVSGLYQGAALGLVVGALFVINEIGASNVAGTGAIVLILLRAFAYSQQLQQAHHRLGESLAAVGTVAERIASYRSSTAVTGDSTLASIEALEFCDVSYSYRADRRALDQVSFTVGAGEVIGVVGPSGAGKSTLVQLLLRLRSPDQGRYLVNGRDAADYANPDWVRLVSFLPQEPKLIAGTVADNIRFLRDLSAAQIEAAAGQAHLHDEIVSWPEGYETPIGQRADAISGGQAQRLCLARALATGPELLVLDEPTSALDATSEHHVQEALRALRGTTTTFIIAHRLSTLSICDRILVLKDGRIEGMGPRQQLADESGFYRDALRLSGLT